MATTRWRIFHFAPQFTGVYRTRFYLPSGTFIDRTRVFQGD
jgi:hypothetical protein